MTGDTIPDTVSCRTISRGLVVPLLTICCCVDVEENFPFLVGCKRLIVIDNGKLTILSNAFQTIVALGGEEDFHI